MIPWNIRRKARLWGGFLIWPLAVVGILAIVERLQPSGVFFSKISATLAGYAVGSIVPLVHGDELFEKKFGTITKNDRSVTLTLTDQDRERLEEAKMIVWCCFALGLVIWIANLALKEPWLLRPGACAYFLLAGALQVYIRNS